MSGVELVSPAEPMSGAAPCPRCGSTELEWIARPDDWECLRCPRCGLRGGAFIGDARRGVSEWNRTVRARLTGKAKK